jgi:hypothetical protein
VEAHHTPVPALIVSEALPHILRTVLPRIRSASALGLGPAVVEPWRPPFSYPSLVR